MKQKNEFVEVPEQTEEDIARIQKTKDIAKKIVSLLLQADLEVDPDQEGYTDQVSKVAGELNAILLDENAFIFDLPKIFQHVMAPMTDVIRAANTRLSHVHQAAVKRRMGKDESDLTVQDIEGIITNEPVVK